ncbi:hypothetical protein BJV77DRAFT_375325 [Russula vinacea]|nr:hypothetical protein BJV77DRAFT_375325 [Russula vinacea]
MLFRFRGTTEHPWANPIPRWHDVLCCRRVIPRAQYCFQHRDEPGLIFLPTYFSWAAVTLSTHRFLIHIHSSEKDPTDYNDLYQEDVSPSNILTGVPVTAHQDQTVALSYIVIGDSCIVRPEVVLHPIIYFPAINIAEYVFPSQRNFVSLATV